MWQIFMNDIGKESEINSVLRLHSKINFFHQKYESRIKKNFPQAHGLSTGIDDPL